MEKSQGAAFRKIMVGFDGSKDSIKAIDAARSIAEKFGSQLIIVHVYSVSLPIYAGGGTLPYPEISGVEEVQKRDALDVLTRGLELAKKGTAQVKGELLEARSTLTALLEYSSGEQVDLIVVGTRGLAGLKRLIMGSVSSGLVHNAECPVLVVR